jgi:6-phosphofructokinase
MRSPIFDHFRSWQHSLSCPVTMPTSIGNARTLGLNAVISIGGDGSMKIADEFFHKSMPIVGEPKTIDNDHTSTDASIKFTPPASRIIA